MPQDRSIFHLAIPCGSWFGVQVRLSIWFVFVVFALCARRGDLTLGLTYSGILLLSVLAHEFGHVLVARRTGGSADEIDLTPIGGLTPCQPGPSPKAHLMSVLAGPFTNLMICGLTMYPMLKSPYAAAWFDPFTFPEVVLKGKAVSQVMPELIVLAFKANWMLFLVNLLPAHPLDAGSLLLQRMTREGDVQYGKYRYLSVGAFVGVTLVIGGMIVGNTWVMGIGVFVLVLNMIEQFQMHMVPQEESEASFMGYDFSEGYTSLERSEPEEEPTSPGMLDRWKQQREEEKRRKQEDEERQLEKTLDALLEKLHTQGEQSLTSSEKRQLQQISAKFRERNRRQ